MNEPKPLVPPAPPEVLNQAALDQAPKTLREALERALKYAETHKLGSCVYRNSAGNPCIIGQFFTKAQLDTIVKSRNNKKAIRVIAKEFGALNIEAMTGMTVRQADALQRLNDEHGAGELRTVIQQVLDGKRKEIKYVEFKLEAV